MMIPKNLDMYKKMSPSEAKDYNEVSINPNEFSLRYNIEMLFDEKIKIKFIKKVESIIRRSMEYKKYTNIILKQELDITRCVAIPGIDLNDIKAYGLLEFHHYPLTLFDIVSIELNKLVMEGERYISPYLLADTVVRLHYKNLVGLVPLSITVHELVHGGQYFINRKYVISNLWRKYVDSHEKYMTEELAELIDKIELMDSLSIQEDRGADLNGSILNLNFLHVDTEGVEVTKIVTEDDVSHTA